MGRTLTLQRVERKKERFVHESFFLNREPAEAVKSGNYVVVLRGRKTRHIASF